ncbi:MAG TPA: serine/threonine-protein kinase [Polyangia bacterium]|nr:serine/threonine-protein kinase [Polyangia bacterium]
MIGDTFGGYEIIAKISAGGMGAVYLAKNQYIARNAAIKVLHPELSQDPDAVTRLFREARAASLIRHHGIVEVFDCAMHPSGSPYVVMEHLEGESVAERIKRLGPFSVQSAIVMAKQIANALAAVHRAGLAHRDLKPGNIFLVQRPGEAETLATKILDFGIVKAVSAETGMPRITKTGIVLGTPDYMSPEQCRGDRNINQRTDIYSLGCLIYALTAGRPPFVRESPGDLLLAHIAEVPPPLSRFVKAPPPSLEQLVAQMVRKSPSDRPQTMEEIELAIEGCLLELRAPQTPLAVERTTAPRRFQARRSARFIAALAVAAAVAVVAGVFGVGLVRRERRSAASVSVRPAPATPAKTAAPVLPSPPSPSPPPSPLRAPVRTAASLAPESKVHRSRSPARRRKSKRDPDGLMGLGD